MKKNNINKIVILGIFLSLITASIPMSFAALSISLSDTNPDRGDTITVTVNGGSPNGPVMMQFKTSSGVLWADQDNFTAGGTFTYTLKIPMTWPKGGYSLYVKDHNADIWLSKSFAVGYIPKPATIPPNKLPKAKAGADQISFVGRMIYLDGSESYDPDGEIYFYTWYFGDQTSQEGAKASHIYTKAGTYTALLVVTDDRGGTSSDSVKITVEALLLTPTSGVDEGVDAGETNYIVDASTETDTTVKLSTTSQVTVYVLRYPSNPHPDVPLPEYSLGTVVDIAMSDLNAVSWPIHVERHYTDTEVAGKNESKLAIYYYKTGTWHRCRETGVYEELNTVWADMYEDEVTGSPTIIAVLPTAATFILSNLTTTPENIEPGDQVTISVDLTNVGDLEGNYTLNLEINDVEEDSQTYTLNSGASTTYETTLTKTEEGTYTVQVGDLSANFTVTAPPPPPPPPPTPAEFEVSDLQVTPGEAEPDEDVSVTVNVENVGEEAGEYTVEVKLDGSTVDSGIVSLEGGESTTVGFTLSTDVEGTHTVTVDGLTGSFEVMASTPPPPPTPAEFEVSDLIVTPEEVEPGEAVSVSVKVSNVGEESGGYSVELKLDGSLTDTKSVTLDGGDSTTTEFSVTSEEPGKYMVAVEDLYESFMVTTPPAKFPWAYVIVAVFVIAVVAYFFYTQRQS